MSHAHPLASAVSRLFFLWPQNKEPYALDDGKDYLINHGEQPTYLANGQPFKLLGIPYLVGKIKFKLFFQGPLAK